MAKANLKLIVEPIAIMGTGGDINEPLDEAALNACFIIIARRTVWLGERVGEIGLRADIPGVGIPWDRYSISQVYLSVRFGTNSVPRLFIAAIATRAEAGVGARSRILSKECCYENSYRFDFCLDAS
jgi:hypothetical protein